MSAPEEPTAAKEGVQGEDVIDNPEGDGSRERRVRTESGGYSITDEQEKTLLAGEDEADSDRDVIEINVKDFDSDMEEEFQRKDAKRIEKATETAVIAAIPKSMEVLDLVRIIHSPDHEKPLEGFEDEEPAPDDEDEDVDRDVIQIGLENADDLLEESPPGGENAEKSANVSVRVSDATENERILSKPLVKQVVMDVEGNAEDDKMNEQDNAAGSPKDGEDDRVETPIGTQEDSDAEQPLVIADSIEANVGEMSGRHQEDPADLQLKLDLHQDMGEMDWKPQKNDRVDAGERFQIKQEPMSPDRCERILSELEDIPTIEISSDDDFPVQPQRSSKKKKKSKKTSKKRSKSESSVLDDDPSTERFDAIHSNDLMIMDEALIKTVFRMDLRKRKSATSLEGNGNPSPTRKRRNPGKKSDACSSSMGQSKSRASILPEKPAKKAPSQKHSIFQPISSADKLKSNSLYADCKKPEVLPPSPLLDKALFETAFITPPAPLHTRQTKFIDALPMPSSVVVKSGHKFGNEQPRRSANCKARKPSPAVPEAEMLHSLENDLAMSSSDEEAPLQSMRGSARDRSPGPKKPGRKRGRAPKQRIEDYFGSSPGSKKDSQPTETTPVKDGKKAKRRKKRTRLCSSSNDSEDETTTTMTESVSLAGTSSTITTARSVTTTRGEDDDDEQQQVELEPPKTEEMRIVISPLTTEKIEKLCNTPKKPRAQSKAVQTEVEGLTWSINLDQIDFHSEYFDKLYQLISNGRRLRNQLSGPNANIFEGVVMVGRDAVQPPTPTERSPQRPPAAVNGHARSGVDRLLFERDVDEIEFVTAARVDPAARERMMRSIRSNFRIPKVAKQPSRSPQDVTSSTQHDNDDANQRSSSGSVGSNDRNDAPEPRRHITIETRSPVRISNRPEVAAPVAAASSVGGNTARPLAPIRRTIRNDNVQQQQPAENGYPTYGPPEQRQPQPPPQYQASSGSYMPQQLPQPLQQQQFGGYSASGQEMDIKPSVSALVNPAARLGNDLNHTLVDSFRLVCQLLMQQQQQQLQFPAINAPGQTFPGPSVVQNIAACNSTPAPPPMPTQMMQPSASGAGPRFENVPDGVQHDEVSDQISQIFGCVDSLNGRCIKNPCLYSHTLPTDADLFQNLLGSAQDVVMATYQFIVSLDNLFIRYFPVYAKLMGLKNMRHQLLDAVQHCEQSKRAFHHYRCIVDGLTENKTLTKAKAVQLVLERHRKIDFHQINVLISLIIDTGDEVPQFLQWLENFSQVKDYHYEIGSINLLLGFCVRSSRATNSLPNGPVSDVAKLTYGLVMNVASGKERFVDTDSLFQYTELLMKSNLGLDHEKIEKKYGKYPMGQSAGRN